MKKLLVILALALTSIVLYASTAPEKQPPTKTEQQITSAFRNTSVEFFPLRQYPTFSIQCVAARPTLLSKPNYFIFLIENDEIQWYYQLGFINDEPANGRSYYKDCSY